MDPYIGKLLDGRYEILSVLGTGGMAVVYRAYCHRLNRYVAVKILKSELASDQDLRRRFHDESQAVAMLSHPNIVGIYDVSQVDDCEFIVMELIDGITLKQYMQKRGGSLNWREALHFITQILQGLKHAHSRGIIHRDIKPQNVMVLRDGSVKVTDFGIARSTTSQSTLTQEAIGSVHYISPEQARGSHVDERSDIYSAGVVLYEMLTGRLPFEGENPVSVALQHINSIPAAPRELNPSIPLGMEQITIKAMASVPDRRYASAEQMLQDLESFRKNPEVDFGYVAPGMITPEEDEPTVVRKGGSFLEEDDSDRTMRSNPARRSAPARFEHPQEPRRAAEPDYEYDGDFDDEEEDEEDRRRNRRFIAITASAAAVLVLIFVILWFTLFRGLFTSSASYPVPDLLGCTLEEAQAVIDGDDTYKDHFTITVGAYEPSDEYEEGKISKQSPESTRSVKADVTEITVTVSTGPQEEEPEPIELEDYTNADYREVKSKLDNLHLVTVCTPEYSDTVSEGYVVRTDPVAGTQLQEGDTVTIYYSQGPEVKPVTVTSLLGLSENDARTAIAYMHLTLGSVDEEYSNDYAAGKVCYQSIPKDTVVDEQTTINIVISLGPEPEPEEPDEPEPTTPTEPTTPAVSRKEIVVNLPADRTEVCTVTLVINGVQVCNATVEVGETEFSQVYEGDIISIAVLVNNEAYQDYDIVDTGT